MKRREGNAFGACQVLAELWVKAVKVVLNALGWSVGIVYALIRYPFDDVFIAS